jgi:transposase
MTYPIGFRKKIIKLHKEGETYKELSIKFGVSMRTLIRWNKDIKPKLNRDSKYRKINDELLINDIIKYPDSYSYERASRLGCSTSGIQKAMRRLKVTYKKNPKSPKGMCREKIYVLPKDRRT